MTITVYEQELQEIFKIWVFGFACSNCIQSDTEPSYFRYITPLMDANSDEGTFASSPTICCGCEEILYIIRSHGLYDLLDSLFERDQAKINIIIEIRGPKINLEEEKETFGYSIESLEKN